ncbi:hypothetical protein KQI11_10025 [Acetanaerobacterium sp. MSJ-12]|uniref:DUF5711 family protein n=1 Tax=Acetanaerobacterium sp. MSJ-12 TaxID=2841535 RepID=UPI001C0F2B70|nr:hypothetical protein [Acetanaerobacterium sp. MSJ-12]
MRELSDIELARRKKKRKKTVKKLVLLALLAVVLVVGYGYRHLLTAENLGAVWGNMTSNLQKGEGYPLDLGSGVPRDLQCSTMGALEVLTDSEIITYNKTAKQVKNIPHSMDEPQMKVRGGNTVVFDRGNREFALYSKTTQVYKKTAEMTIVDADVDASGNVAVATGSDRYLGQVSVYDRNQQLVFGWSSSKEYILSVSMGSGGNLAVACVNAVDGRVTTVVYALNIHREEELSRTEFPGSLALQMRWEGSTIQLVCDDQVFALKKDGSLAGSTAFEGSVLAIGNIGGGDYAVALGDNTQSHLNKVLLVGQKGQVKATVEVGREIVGVYASGGKIAVLGHSDLTVYKKDGTVLSTTDIGKPCLDLSGAGKALFVQTNDSLEKLTL